MEPEQMVTAQEIEEGCKILSVNWRKDVEPEFKQLLFNEFCLFVHQNRTVSTFKHIHPLDALIVFHDL